MTPPLSPSHANAPRWPGRTLAVDWGTKRLGLALSDEGGSFASPLDVLTIRNEADALTQIAAQIKQTAAVRVLVGLAMNMDGSVSSSAKACIAFAKNIAAATGVEVLLVDERLSSFAAEEQLKTMKRAGAKLTHAKKKQQLDALAAAAFLQDFLNGSLAPIDVSSFAARASRP